MRSYIPEDRPEGIYIADMSKRALSEGPPAAPVCKEHGESLGAVSKVPELTLREGRVLAVCPECYGADGELDAETLHQALDANWDQFDHHFAEQAPPTTGEPLNLSNWVL